MNDEDRLVRAVDNHELRQLVALGIVFCIALMTYGFSAFNMNLVMDDWQHIHDPFHDTGWLIGLNRWGQILFWAIAQKNIFAPSVTLLASLVLVLAGVRVLAATFKIRGFWDILFFAALFVLCPTLSEHFADRSNHLSLGATILFVCIAFSQATNWARLSPQHRRWIGMLSPLFLLTFSLGTMQVSIFMFFVLVAFYLAKKLSENGIDRQFFRVGGTLSCLGLSALGMSLMIGALLRSMSGISAPSPNSEYGLNLISSFSEFQMGFSRTAQLIMEFMAREQHLWPVEVKILFLMLFSFCGFTIAVAALRKGGMRAAGLALALLFAMILLPWGLNLVRLHTNTYRYTALLGVAPIYPLVCACAYQAANGRLKTLVGLFLAFIIFTFALMDNAAGLATYVSNQRDLHITSSILSSVRTRSGNKEITTYYLAGKTTADDSLPFTLATEGLLSTSAAQCGVYNCQTRRFHDAVLMIEPPSKNQYIALETDQLIAKALKDTRARTSTTFRKGIEKARPWPNEDAIVIDFESSSAFIFLDEESINTARENILEERSPQADHNPKPKR